MNITRERAISLAHLLVVLVGTICLMCVAAHDHVWFDEAYSSAMAHHPFQEIWAIGSTDVHPVLYYWMLHCLDLIFGPSVPVFRIFSSLGIGVLSLLGFTHIRKDFGTYCGFSFSILVFLTPWCIQIATQIRMYAWLSVVVMLAAIYAWRIVQVLNSGQGRIKPYWWAVLMLASLAAAYLQYYGAFSAFVIQLIVFISLVRSKLPRKGRYILLWAGLAIVVVLLYVPWLLAVANQVKQVTDDFWITIEFPTAFYELVMFPFYVFGSGYPLIKTALVYLYLAVIALEIACAYELGKSIGDSADNADADGIATDGSADDAGDDVDTAINANSGTNIETAKVKSRLLSKPLPFFLIIFLGTAGIAALASQCINQPILYFRYLTSSIGPVVFAFAWILTKLRQTVVAKLTWLLIAILGVSFFVAITVKASDPQNDQVIQDYEAFCEEARSLNGDGSLLVFSGEEGLATIVAVEADSEPIIYTDPHEKYRAFEPHFIVDQLWENYLDNYEGTIVYIGYDDDANWFAEQHGGTVIESVTSVHPWSGWWLVYHLIDLGTVQS